MASPLTFGNATVTDVPTTYRIDVDDLGESLAPLTYGRNAPPWGRDPYRTPSDDRREATVNFTMRGCSPVLLPVNSEADAGPPTEAVWDPDVVRPNT